MKIKLALLDNDQNYLNRIVSVFNIRYADKLEIYSFTKIESALSALESTRIDVFVSSVAFDVNTAALLRDAALHILLILPTLIP